MYWYDGQRDPRHPGYAAQRVYFDAIASTPGLQFRAGHLVERTPKWQEPIRREQRFHFIPERQQKGVDTLITLDLVNLGQQGAYDTAILIAGDRDLAEAVRTTQAMGRRIIVAHPAGDGIATELRQLADLVQQISREELQEMLEARPEG